MSTVLRLGPNDQGRPVTDEEFMAGHFKEGYRYEIIEGRLYVTPFPNPLHDWVERYVCSKLDRYSRQHPEMINWVTTKARVFVPGSTSVTTPEPDIAAYSDYPQRPFTDWGEVSPILVVEVLSSGNSEKDLKRNVDLYLRVPSIQEYWIFDIREDAEKPTLIVHRREGERWKVTELSCDEVYQTSLLPGLSLSVSRTGR